MGLKKLGNLIIQVSDLERSRIFYVDTLGMTQTGSVPGEFVFLDAGGMTLALREIEASVPKCICELSFQVDDVRSTYQELKGRGVAFRVEPRAVTGDGKRDLYATDFRDPDGHVLSISGWVEKTA